MKETGEKCKKYVNRWKGKGEERCKSKGVGDVKRVGGQKGKKKDETRIRMRKKERVEISGNMQMNHR